MNKRLLLNFGKRVRTERLKLDISQEHLANLAGVHRTYIGMIERGEKNITVENLCKIAKALNVKPEALIKGISDV